MAQVIRTLDLFSGIGGFARGLSEVKLAGQPIYESVAFCEINPFARQVLGKNFPGVPIHHDVRKLSGDQVRRIDLITGGFPCQDISTAWGGAGLHGERSSLWHEFFRITKETLPRAVLIENVGNLKSRGLYRVVVDLTSIGYSVAWQTIPATAVGAPHKRDRLWVVAFRDWDQVVFADDCQPCEQCGEPVCPHCEDHYSECACPGPHSEGYELVETPLGIVAYPDRAGCGEQWRSFPVQAEVAAAQCFDWWRTEPQLDRVANGIPARVDRLRTLGNTVVPQIVTIIGYAMLPLFRVAPNED